MFNSVIHLIEKTLSGEKHKPLTMRPKGYLGYIIICIFKIQACSLVTDVDRSELHVAMETVQAYLKVAKLVRNLRKFASVPE